MKKKLLVGILVLTMLVACFGVNALAAERKAFNPTLVTIKVDGTEVKPEAYGTSQPTSFTNGVWLPTAISSLENPNITVEAKDEAALTFAVNAKNTMTADEITEATLETELAKLDDTNNKLWIKAVKGETTELIGMSFVVMASDAKSLATILGKATAETNTVKLTGDVTVDKVVRVKLGETAVTLDLQGHSITGKVQGDNNTTGSILSLEGGTLTITDSSEETKGSITNTAAENNTRDSSAVQVSNAILTINSGVTLSGGNDVIKISGKTAELKIDGAIIKAVNPKKVDAAAIYASGYPKLTISADAEGKATQVIGKMLGSWAKGSTISSGYYTDFNLKAVTGGESILASEYGLVPVEEDKQDTFAYKVGKVDTEKAEGYVEIDDANKIYGDIDMLVKYYGSGSTDKPIQVKNTATVTLNDFGDVVGGKYGNNNTLSFAKATDAKEGATLTINGTVRVALIKCGEGLQVLNDNLKPATGFTALPHSGNEYKYDISEDNTAVVVEVTFDDNTYKYTAESLGAMFREIQGKEATVKLLKDVTYDQQIALTAASTKLTLDLNGHTYKYDKSGGAAFIVGKDDTAVELKITDTSLTKAAGGVLDASGSDEAICVGDFKAATEKRTATNKLTIAAGVTVKGSVTVLDKGTLEVSGAIEAKGFAISGNGSRDGTKITIHNGASLKSEKTTAIYHPQDGTLIIGDEEAADGAAAPEITGVAGVVVRDGTVTVNDAKITATGDGPISVGDAKDAEGNLVEVPAGGIVLDTVEGYDAEGEATVTVEKAEVKAEEGQPTVTHTAAGETAKPEADAENKGVTVKDGTFKSGNVGDSGVAEYLENNEDGTQGIDPQKGTIAKRDKTWPDSYFEVGGSYYADLNDAISAAESGNQTLVTVLKDVKITSGATIKSTIVLMSTEDVTISGVGRIFDVDQSGNLTINGKVSIDATDDTEDENYAAIKVANGGKLTVKDGASVKAVDTAIYVAGTGELSMTGGTVASTGEIAISSNGSDTGAKIAISGGTVTSEKTAAVYVPSGELTVSGSPEITGKAGIVVRNNGKATVGGTPTVKATGTEKFTVGDAETELEPRAVVVDAPTNAETNTAKVSGGTYTVNDEPDYTVINYVTSENGVDKDGNVVAASEVEDELFIIDFDYIANISDISEEIDETADTWTSPKGIVYHNIKSGKWGDATFYWSFNRALNENETITVTLTCGENTFTDTCADQGTRFASSLKNKTQLGKDHDDAITGGDYTISGGEQFTVSKDLATVQVTLPAEDTKDAPVIGKAPAVHHGDTEITETFGDYTVAYTSANTKDRTYSVVIDATDVKEHLNENGDYGYWVGMTVKYDNKNPANANGYYVKVNGKWQYSDFDTIAGDANKYAIFYFGDIDVYNFQFVWTTDDKYTATSVSAIEAGENNDVMTFTVSTEKVEHGESLRPTPTVPASPTTSKLEKTTNGSAKLSSTTARAGKTVTVTVTPNEGYVVDQVTVTDKNGDPVEVTANADGTYTYTVPQATPVTVTVTFKPAGDQVCGDFDDVDEDAWYHEGVHYAIEQKLMVGTGTGFAPTDNVKRAEVLVVIGRVLGAGVETTGENWYQPSVDYAVEKGYSDGTRALEDIKRVETVTLLWRTVGESAESDEDISGFSDYEDIPSWDGALQAMKWAVEKGIITGRQDENGNITLSPNENIQRCEVAAIYERLGLVLADTETAE